jgi:hypothetical protein
VGTNRPLGLGLVALGATLAGILVLWLVVQLAAGVLSPGGAVLGLLLAAVIGLPLAGAGWLVLSRGRQELAEAETFQAQRRTFEADRLFRADQARELEQLGRRLEVASGASSRLATRLRDLAEDLRRPGYDQSAWYEAVELGAADRQALDRYDGLLSGSLAAIRAGAERVERGDSVGDELEQAVGDYERDLRRRSELLRGRRAPAVRPADLATAEPALGSRETLRALKPSDALDYGGESYLLETSISYFSAGQTWLLHRAVAEREEAWLLVSPGAQELGWLRAEPDGPSAAGDAARDGCSERESFRADALVTTRAGEQSRGVAAVRLLACGDDEVVWEERWEDEGRQRSYRGTRIRPSALEVYPSALDADEGTRG